MQNLGHMIFAHLMHIPFTSCVQRWGNKKVSKNSILCLKNQELPLLLGKNGKLKQATVADVSRPWRFLSEKICYCWYLQQIYQSSLSNLNERNLFNISLSWMYRFSFFNPLSPAAPGDIGGRASCRVRAWIKHPENSVFLKRIQWTFRKSKFWLKICPSFWDITV